MIYILLSFCIHQDYLVHTDVEDIEFIINEKLNELFDEKGKIERYTALISDSLLTRINTMNNKYNKRVYAGYYKRYDGKLIYVITIAKDELSGEDTVIYTPYSLRNDGGYFTISKKDFCEPVKIDGKLKARYKRQTQMRITDDFLEMLICDDLPAPKRKLPPKPDELKSRAYRQSATYYDYAKDLCTNYLADIRRYNYLNTTRSVLENCDSAKEIIKEDVDFLKKCFKTVLKDYVSFFEGRFIKRMSVRKYAEEHNMNRGSVEHIQRKMYQELAVLLHERDSSDGVVRICIKE